MSQRFQKLPMPTVEEQPTCDNCGEEFDDSTWQYERIYDMDLFHIICRRCASESDPELLPDDDPEKLIPEPEKMSQSVDLSPEERAKIVAARADVKYGPFASLHEAYGVLAEELWELDQLGACPLVPNTNAMLLCLHEDDPSAFVTLAINAKQNAINVRKAWAEFGGKRQKTTRVIDECIDVIAVCDRIIAQWGDAS